MTSKGVVITYGDIAPEAKENFVATSNESKFDTLSQLQKYNLNFPNYLNPCDKYSVVLDGLAEAFPSSPELVNIGMWSNARSDQQGAFNTPIVLELNSDGQYSSQGFTFTFDTQNDVYPTRVKIQWYRVTESGLVGLAEKEFFPNSSVYFCQEYVENYNQVKITFYSLNMPQNRLKVRAIDFGYGTEFRGNELRNVRVTQAVDPISTEITIDTVDFTLDSNSDIVYSFQAKQPLSVYFNGKLRATTFVKSAKRKAKFLWDVQSEDYVSILDGVTYYGGMYNGEPAYDVLVDVFNTAKVPYIIDDNLRYVPLYGYIAIGTCREALAQIAFATQRAVLTSDRDAVEVATLGDFVLQTIPKERVMQGQSFTDNSVVTGVEITTHSYVETDETIKVYSAYESGASNNVVVRFPEPLHSLEIEEGDIVKHSANYAVINAYEGCILRGKKYNHITAANRKKRPDLNASAVENIVTVDSATLITTHNINSVMDKCFEWLTNAQEITTKIREGKTVEYGDTVRWGNGSKWGAFKWGESSESVVTYEEPIVLGEKIEIATEYLGKLEGRVIKQAFNLMGGIIIKEAVLK